MNEQKPPAARSGRAKKGKGTKAGRPSLDAQGKSSGQIAFRVIPSVRMRAKEVADREGVTVSQLSRKALKQYIDSAGSASASK